MTTIFCCTGGPTSYRPQYLTHESKFQTFISWKDQTDNGAQQNVVQGTAISMEDPSVFVIQVVRQVNFGPLESKRFFVTADGKKSFHEITETDLVQANYKKLNSYKNFKCAAHNKFFELNVYEKDPVNKHHWRANIARPAGEIDLASGST